MHGAVLASLLDIRRVVMKLNARFNVCPTATDTSLFAHENRATHGAPALSHAYYCLCAIIEL